MDTAMAMVEKGGDALARRYDYTIQGFVAKMKDEPMNEQLNDVLRELLADNADILMWTSNPGVRLCLIYLQAIVFTARRLGPGESLHKTNGATQVGPPPRAPDLRWGRQPDAVRTPKIWEERVMFDASDAGSGSSSGDEA